ncbi:ATPase [Tumebacillus algifaecis]|uniref:ATPase n=1 Tax=Tumebacillus algifaecis TaxID=1214604 RepID=A0A223CZR1_9BACL|nr:ATPase [Tumebacillus algifaecis]ASS74566.1 ATPase [Tumebacillus algifaecis]
MTIETGNLDAAIAQLRDHYNRRLGEQEALLRKKRQVEEKVTEKRAEIAKLEQVKILLQESSAFAREQARRQIETMVTNALQFIFGDQDLEFRVEIDEVRGRAEGEFLVVSTYGGEIPVQTRPQDARGGGVVDVISLALRAALLHANRPRLDGPIILDEPAKHVSEEYSRQVAEFLKQLSTAFGRQIIMVTHNQHLANTGDTAYMVEMRSGKSYVRVYQSIEQA